jgi:hypothetical protein
MSSSESAIKKRKEKVWLKKVILTLMSIPKASVLIFFGVLFKNQ